MDPQLFSSLCFSNFKRSAYERKFLILKYKSNWNVCMTKAILFIKFTCNWKRKERQKRECVDSYAHTIAHVSSTKTLFEISHNHLVIVSWNSTAIWKPIWKDHPQFRLIEIIALAMLKIWTSHTRTTLNSNGSTAINRSATESTISLF